MTPASPIAIFIINLVQDVNILRPLMFMAARDFGFHTLVLTSSKFVGRDLFGIWNAELDQICEQTGADQQSFASDWEAFQHFNGSGVIFAASESSLQAHDTTHNIFRYAPSGFLKVTLQHGFECIGFRHSADHVMAHGATASFGADIVCTWMEPSKLASMATSQRGKVLVTGPTGVLQQFSTPFIHSPNPQGIICENLHSVRLNLAGDFKTEFVDAFAEYCQMLEREGRQVVLRPHPGGQYVLKQKVPLPQNAQINNAPMYRLDLRQFAYGISAPSSVLIDMLLADIPTAVWRDRSGKMDADNYAGLTSVSTPAEWLDFSRSAAADPAPFIELQRGFLGEQGMILDPADVFTRYAKIFQSARRMPTKHAAHNETRERLLFIANAHVPTLQLSFEKPLALLVDRGAIATQLLTEATLRENKGMLKDPAATTQWIEDYLDAFAPSAIIFCRYSGPAYEPVLHWARRMRVPILYHIDDDLLAIPKDIGDRKYRLHNAPERTASVRFLLANADLVYASTPKLRDRLLEYMPELPIVAGKIYCSGTPIRQPKVRQARKIGYMASADHAHNLDMILPAVIKVLDRNPHVQFELFGSIPVPHVLERFGERITTAPPIANYNSFLEEFSRYEWDVGICPLTSIEFNMMKANTKWVEYTTVGAAVVASRETVYDECCSDDCGMLAATEEEWFDALDLLVNDDAERIAMVGRAQQKLCDEYSVGRLQEQVLNMLGLCKERTSARAVTHRQQEELMSAE